MYVYFKKPRISVFTQYIGQISEFTVISEFGYFDSLHFSVPPISIPTHHLDRDLIPIHLLFFVPILLSALFVLNILSKSSCLSHVNNSKALLVRVLSIRIPPGRCFSNSRRHPKLAIIGADIWSQKDRWERLGHLDPSQIKMRNAGFIPQMGPQRLHHKSLKVSA
jgi:hypothetical protein